LGCNVHQDAFDENGDLLMKYVNITEPSDAACGQCHGVVGEDAQTPLTFELYDMHQWTTYTTGQVFSPQRISNSAMNIEDKTEIARSWDVHAERVVNCVDCHYSLNNPVFYVEDDASRPDHLEFDPRRMEINDYLERPLHQFANGGADYADAFPVFDGAMRDCATCHDAESTHTWLPYSQRHIQAMQCETCHIPTLHAPALASIDWTVLDNFGEPIRTFRGVDAESEPDLITGYDPVLLPDEEGKIAPYNLVSAWYWVSGEDGVPVPEDDLRAAYFANGTYHEDVIAAFDIDGDGSLKSSEMLLDTDEEEAIITARLTELGHENPRIVAETETYEIHHNVTQGEWAIRECSTCHAEDTRFAVAVTLSDRTPGGVVPDVSLDGVDAALETDETGALLLVPEIALEPVDLYILGRDSSALVDWAGILIFLGTMAGVFVHGGLRVLAARRMPAPQDPELREVYMYTIYERQWHWLQSALIFGLIFTGLVIHKPHMFGFLSFRWMVLVHNAFALILIINAALAAFYHLVSGEIKQFLPEPKGFFGQMFAQARYYAWGIFRGEPHPIEKTRERKMNPIQQVTYFGLLNVLLPLQVITGTLMWGAQHFPGVTDFFGGLPLLAPFHSLIAWLLASFIVLHVYMTTTGHTPLANIRAMIFGWDEIETHEAGGHVQQPATGD
jgi:thiosulfate reductase cytochrome b subunit